MPAKSDPREESAPVRYTYRRTLTVAELLPAIGAGVVAGAAVFYLAGLLLQRTPLLADAAPRRPRALPRSRRA